LAGLVAKTQYYTATSIDGFIADPGNSLDWLFEAGSPAGKEDHFAAFFAASVPARCQPIPIVKMCIAVVP
jgi:hypothetical protein